MLWYVLGGVAIGYITHDAVQPTAVGKQLDKISFPPTLLTTKGTTTSSTT